MAAPKEAEGESLRGGATKKREEQKTRSVSISRLKIGYASGTRSTRYAPAEEQNENANGMYHEAK